MSFPLWTPALSVGESHLDAQHRALFEAADRLLQVLDGDATEEALRESLAFLRRYMLRHFGTEEALLAAAEYPDLGAHREAHQKLSRKLLELEVLGTRSGRASRARGMKILVERLVSHIQVEDQAYASCLREVEQSAEVDASSGEVPMTGFSSIDRDHFCFLGLLHGFQEAVLAGQGEDELPEFLEALSTYATEHFRREEMLMELVDYPAREAHRRAHQSLLTDLTDLKARQDIGEAGLAVETLHFFRHWLQAHIGKEDTALVPYLRELEE